MKCQGCYQYTSECDVFALKCDAYSLTNVQLMKATSSNAPSFLLRFLKISNVHQCFTGTSPRSATLSVGNRVTSIVMRFLFTTEDVRAIFH